MHNQFLGTKGTLWAIPITHCLTAPWPMISPHQTTAAISTAKAHGMTTNNTWRQQQDCWLTSLNNFKPRSDMRIGRISLDIFGLIHFGDVSVTTHIIRPGRTIELVETTMAPMAKPVSLPVRGVCKPATAEIAGLKMSESVIRKATRTGTAWRLGRWLYWQYLS